MGLDWTIWPQYTMPVRFLFDEIRFGFEVSVVPVSLPFFFLLLMWFLVLIVRVVGMLIWHDIP